MQASRRAMTVQASTSASAAPMSRASARAVAVSSRYSLTSWDDSRHTASTLAPSARSGGASAGPRRKVVTMMGNKATTGPFAPLVVVTRNVIGEKDFNNFRGKAISYHSQVIKEFCKLWGIDNKQVQGVIRLAKKNGEWLGFLA